MSEQHRHEWTTFWFPRNGGGIALQPNCKTCRALLTTERANALERVAEAAARNVDDEPCDFDHRGGCQEHGFLTPGGCGMAQLQAVLRELRTVDANEQAATFSLRWEAE